MRMKKVFIILSILLTLVAIPATVFLAVQQQELRKKAAPATTLAITPSTVTKNVGEEFSVDVKMDTGENAVVAAEVHVTYDATKLEGISITNGAFMTNIIAPGVIEAGTASISVGAVNSVTPARGQGNIATIRFKTLAVTTSPISLRIGSTSFLTGPGEGTKNLLIGSSPSTVTIRSSGAASATPTPTPTQSSTNATPTSTRSGTLSPTPTNNALTPTPTRTTTIVPTPTVVTSTGTRSLTIATPTNNANVSESVPVIRGTAPPGSTVTVTIYSSPQTCTVVADQTGSWVCSPSSPLASGPHTVVASSFDTTSGQSQSVSQTFVVVTGSTASTSSNGIPVSGNESITLVLIALSIILFLSGLQLARF